jgi:uncharacterized membrane protein
VSKRSRRRNRRGGKKGAIVPKPGPTSPQTQTGPMPPGGDLASIVSISSESSFSGPLPPPQILREFDEVIPGAAERIVKMAEKQQDHRIRLESRVITSDIIRSWAGLILGACLGIVIVGCGSYLVHEGHDTAGATIITGTLVSLVTAFMSVTKSRRQERESKSPGRIKQR